MAGCVHGLRHRPTLVKRKECNTSHYLLTHQDVTPDTMLGHHYSREIGPNIHQACGPLQGATEIDSHGSGLDVYVEILESNLQGIGHQSEVLYSIPPTDRWADREVQCRDGAVPAVLR